MKLAEEQAKKMKRRTRRRPRSSSCRMRKLESKAHDYDKKLSDLIDEATNDKNKAKDKAFMARVASARSCCPS